MHCTGCYLQRNTILCVSGTDNSMLCVVGTDNSMLCVDGTEIAMSFANMSKHDIMLHLDR